MAKRKYRPTTNHRAYEVEDRTMVVNGRDPVLRPIRLSLPKAPPLHTIDGYGLDIKNQRFRRVEPPERLATLERKVLRELNDRSVEKASFTVTGYAIYKEFWKQLESDVEYYADAIEYIQQMWYYMVNGYWFFNHGKPTWLSPWHFRYLHFFYLVESHQYPDYRDRDRRWFNANWYAWTSTESFAKLSKDGEARQNEEGEYDMRDVGQRVLEGTANSKGRRMGDTYKALCVGDWFITQYVASKAGIISFGGEGAKAAFRDKYIPAWQRQPIWLKPVYKNNNDPSSVDYDVPRNVFGEEGLGSFYDYAGTSSEAYYDSKKINFLFCDETGKTDRRDVNSRWGTLRYCLREGEEVIGFSIQPTTVEEMDSGGGKEFFEMMENANFYVRDKDTGRTRNGLMRLFFRASDGRKGFIDSYGYSVEFEPTDWQVEEGFTVGAFDYLKRERDIYLMSGRPSDQKLYREHQRKNPIYYMDSFVSESADLGFDYAILGETISRLRQGSEAKRYNIMADPENPHGQRYLQRDPDGKFVVSIDYPQSLWNRKVKDYRYDPVVNEHVEEWRPEDMTRFVASADPITFVNHRMKRSQKDLSKASGGILELKHPDDANRSPEDWSGYLPVVTYIHQPYSTEEYVDDMINMCVLFGAMMYPERNKELIVEQFIKRGYGGYLLYDIDSRGKRKPDPGWYANNVNKQDAFTLIRDWITFRGRKCEHLELMEQLNDIRSIDEMTRYDLVAVMAGLMLGAKSRYGEQMEQFDSVEIDMDALAQAL